MEWDIDYMKKDGVVSAKISGIMDWDQHKKFAEDMVSFAVKPSGMVIERKKTSQRPSRCATCLGVAAWKNLYSPAWM